MAFEQKDNSGSLFVNDKRQPGSQQPDRSGSALIDGVEYWVSGWIKKKQDGSAWLSLAFKRKEAPTKAMPTKRQQTHGVDAFGDDPPF